MSAELPQPQPDDGHALPDFSSPEARLQLFRLFRFLQALELADFVRMMSDFPAALQAASAGDEKALERYFSAMTVDVQVALKHTADDVRHARKDLAERSAEKPIGSGREYFTQRRAVVA